MTATEERASALVARVDAARAVVAQLHGEIATAETAVHELNLAGEFTRAEGQLATVSKLRLRLASAEAQLEALEAAQREVAAAAAVEQHRQAAERHTAALARHRDAASACLSEVGALLSAIKAAVRQAQEHEQAGREAAHALHGVRVTLGEAAPTIHRVPGSPSEVQAALERNRLLIEIANDPQY